MNFHHMITNEWDKMDVSPCELTIEHFWEERLLHVVKLFPTYWDN